MFTLAFCLKEGLQLTHGYMFMSDGGFTSSTEDIVWFESRQEAEKARKSLPQTMRCQILSDEDVAELELDFKRKKLEKYRAEKKKVAKMTKAEQKELLDKMIRDGAKISKKLISDVPPISTKLVMLSVDERKYNKAEQKDLLNEITLTQDGDEIAKIDKMVSDGVKTLKKLSSDLPPISTKIISEE
jgi:hypothetical protein